MRVLYTAKPCAVCSTPAEWCFAEDVRAPLSVVLRLNRYGTARSMLQRLTILFRRCLSQPKSPLQAAQLFSLCSRLLAVSV